MDQFYEMMAQAQAFAAGQQGSLGLGVDGSQHPAAMLQASYYSPHHQQHQQLHQQPMHHHTALAQGPPPQRAPAPGHGDLHRLKVCGVPAGDFTDARLRQLFELCGKVGATRASCSWS